MSPFIKAVVPRALASAQGHSGQPKDEEDHRHDPKEVQSKRQSSK